MDDEYLRWKQSQGGLSAPQYSPFGEDALKFEQLLNLKNKGMYSTKFNDEDFMRYEQWKNSQARPAPVTPAKPVYPAKPSYAGEFDMVFMQKLNDWNRLNGRLQYPMGYNNQNMAYNTGYNQNSWGYQPSTPARTPWTTPQYNSFPTQPTQHSPVVNPNFHPAPAAPAPLSMDQMTKQLDRVLNNQIDVFAEDKACTNANVALTVDADANKRQTADSRCSNYYSVTKDGVITCVPAGDTCSLADEAGSVVFYIPGATIAQLDEAVAEAEIAEAQRKVVFSPITGETVEKL